MKPVSPPPVITMSIGGREFSGPCEFSLEPERQETGDILAVGSVQFETSFDAAPSAFLNLLGADIARSRLCHYTHSFVAGTVGASLRWLAWVSGDEKDAT